MKAIVQNHYGPPEVLALADIDPPAVGANRVLVRVHAASVNAGDWHYMTGTPTVSRLALGLFRPRAKVRGWDVAGTVEEIGSKVTRFAVGDAVYGSGSGTFAELACLKEDGLIAKPDDLTFEQAAALPTAGMTALQGLTKAGVEKGQNVLIIGAGGGVGHFAVQIAKARGATVTGVCGTDKVELVRSLGADEVVDYTTTELPDGPYDLIFDIAGRRPLPELRRRLNPGGRLLIVGGEGGGAVLGDLRRGIKGIFASLFSNQKVGGFISFAKQTDLATLDELARTGQVLPTIDRTYPLSAAPQAIGLVGQNHTRGKIVIQISRLS
jgi:NADPH:quinone reductase-like Zn-dependent oxidoreductase